MGLDYFGAILEAYLYQYPAYVLRLFLVIKLCQMYRIKNAIQIDEN